MAKITIGSGVLDLRSIVAVARAKQEVVVDHASIVAMERSREVVDAYIDRREPVYGVSTQFGSDIERVDQTIELDDADVHMRSLQERQAALVRSHQCGVGDAVSADIVRAAMLLRAHSLAQGHSGVRPVVVQALIDHLNTDALPVVRRYGSVGASGDLIPLSAIAELLVADGLQLHAKEGLALMNGTSFMTGAAALTLADMRALFPVLLSAIGMTLESFTLIDGAYQPFVHHVKGHPGQIAVNDFLRSFFSGTELIDQEGIQDYYSLRAVPQGFGPFYENILRATEWIEREANSVNDNPIVGTDPDRVYHGANFMGYFVTQTCDMLVTDIAQAGTWIHALLGNLLNPRKSKGLPANLTQHPYSANGFKATQLLAASLAVEIRKRSLPYQAVMLPTEGDNQDVVSLGAHAAFNLRDTHTLLEYLVAILLLAGAQALELRGVDKASPRARALHDAVRSVSAFVDDDRPLHDDIDRVVALIRSNALPCDTLFT